MDQLCPDSSAIPCCICRDAAQYIGKQANIHSSIMEHQQKIVQYILARKAELKLDMQYVVRVSSTQLTNKIRLVKTLSSTVLAVYATVKYN